MENITCLLVYTMHIMYIISLGVIHTLFFSMVTFNIHEIGNVYREYTVIRV